MATLHDNSRTLVGGLPFAAASSASMRGSDVRRGRQVELLQRADFCSRALSEARGLVAAAAFGSTLTDLLARACDVLDEMDEVLITLNPRLHRGAYLHAAELHRALEEIQALLPRHLRGLPRARHRYRPAHRHRTAGASGEPVG